MLYTPHGVRAYIFHQGKVLLLKRSSADQEDAQTWDIPGGKIEEKETAFSALKREILEETGIDQSDVSIKDLLGILVEPYSEKITLEIAIFWCESKTNKISLSSEHSDFKWALPKELDSTYHGRFIDQFRNQLQSLVN